MQIGIGIGLSAPKSIASVAKQGLLRLGGVGMYIDWVANSMCIIDMTTPANNYDGVITGKLTYTGSPPIGSSGGLVVSTGKYGQMNCSAFPFNLSEGTLAVEVIRNTVSTFTNWADIAATGGNITLRSGSSALNARLTAGSAVIDDNGIRTYVGVPHCIGGGYKVNDIALTKDGRTPFKNTTATMPTAATTLTFGNSGGIANYAEILRFWYIPTKLANTVFPSLMVPRLPRTFYADAVAGNDANDGLTSATAKATLAVALDSTQVSLRHCDTLVLNGRFRESQLAVSLPFAVNLIGANSASPPVIDGSRDIASGAWSADGVNANVYKTTVTQTVSTPGLFYPMIFWGNLIGRDRKTMWSVSTSSVLIGTGSKTFTVGAGLDFRVGDRAFIRNSVTAANYMLGTVTAYSGTTLTVNVMTTNGSGTLSSWTIRVTSELIGRWGGANIAANRATLTPGSFTCFKTGSTTENPVNDTAGTSYDYYIYLPDSSNPASSVDEIAYAEQHNIFTLNGAERFTDIVVQRTAAKDMVNKNAGDLLMTSTRLQLLDFAAHGIVDSPANHANGVAVGLRRSKQDAAGGGWHFFRDDVSLGTALGCAASGCFAISCGNGYYSHGVGGGDEQVRVDITGCVSADCSNGIETGKTTQGWHISGHTYANCVVNGHLNFPLLDVETP